MLLCQRRRKCRELTGPTPHAVAVRAKFPSSRPADQLTLDRQKQEAFRDQVLDSTQNQRSCDITASWLQSSQLRFLRGAVDRRVQAALDQQEVHVAERRDRLRVLLETEEQQLQQEMEEMKETSLEKQAKMRGRAKALREERERERRQLVSHKLEQQFREQCVELRGVQSRRTEQQVCEERAAQVRSRQRQREQQQQEEELMEELWEADRRAKEEKEAQREEHRRQRSKQQLDDIRSQMEEAAQQRKKHRELRDEEAELTQEDSCSRGSYLPCPCGPQRRQQEVQRLQEQRERQQAQRDRLTRRKQLDQGLRLKMKRLSREQQDELQLDMSVLQTLLQQEVDERRDAAVRKAEWREEQQRYRQHLSEELKQQRREEEEIEQLVEESLKEVWTKRAEQSRLQREARNRLMEEVMEARSLQIPTQTGPEPTETSGAIQRKRPVGQSDGGNEADGGGGEKEAEADLAGVPGRPEGPDEAAAAAPWSAESSG
uniref:Cilia- and flagella-associated protein 53 n=1 Tax=Gasterosteus aculeatus aculeatus TaxID=481459 RepID=A0AAQ4QXH9_GASAC